MSQTELAAILGLGSSSISQYEMDKQVPKPKTIRQIAEALGVPVTQLTTGDQDGQAEIISGPDSEKIVRGFITSVPIKLFLGALASLGDDDDAEYVEDGYYEIPMYFIDTGNPEDFTAVRVAGSSMLPRIESGEIVLIRLDSSPRVGSISLVKTNEDRIVLKVLTRNHDGKMLLRSINPAGATFTDLDGWQMLGYATAVFGNNTETRNIWFAGGNPIKP